jgi:hypothetical protein
MFDRHVRANESDLFAVGTISYDILASIWAPSLAGSPTFTGTDYLERPRRFLHALKICLTFIRFPSIVCDLGAFLHHGDYVQTTYEIGEPSVKHDVLGSESCFQSLIKQLDNHIRD